MVKKDAQAIYRVNCSETYVPDAIFENYLETHDADGNSVSVGDATSMGNGIADDNYVFTSAIENVTLLELPYSIPAPGGVVNPATQVSDITGIEDFIALITLDIRFQNIATLDVTANINLEKLTCFTSEVSTLDISTNTKLEELTFVSNKVTEINVTNNTLLRKIYASGNNITAIDFSTNVLLDWIYLSKNELSNIDLRHNPLLEKLLLNDNLLVNLDLSANSKLENIQIQNNQLTTVNIKNGNNSSITSFEATNNPNLTCIEVDNATDATAGTGNYTGWNKDVTASYNEDCSFSVWSGNTSSDWNVSTNWSGNTTPLATDNVFIPNVVTAPIINGGITVEVNSLTVNAASEFNIASDGAAVIASDFMNNGTVSITSTVNNSGVLFVKGAANGQVTYERGGLIANEWSIVSAPVVRQSIKEFVENPLNDIRKNTTVTPNRYAIGYYDDSKVAGTKWIYYTTDDLTTNMLTFEKGRSYAISRITDGSVLFTGTIETANVTKLVTASTWNAVGNPYTTFLPINENGGVNFVNDNTAKLNPANVGVYVWDNVQGKYTGRSLVTAESSLAPGQGFFIKTTTGVSSIVFNEAQRKVQPLTGGNFSRGTTKAKTPSIQLLAKSKEATINTTIKYLDNATKQLDPGYDLGNYERATFDVFTRLVASEKSENFTIQALPKSAYEEMSIPIGIKSEANKEISFAINALHLPEKVEVFIEDKDKNIFTKLDAEGKLSYKAKITKKVNGIGRFYLHTKQSDLAEVPDFNSVKIYTIANKSLMIKGISKGNVEVVLYNINGAATFRKTVKAKGENILNNLNMSTGVYIVKVQSDQGVHTKKISIN